MRRSVPTVLAVAAGLLAVSSLWLAPSSATAQPAPTSTASPPTTTTPPGPLVPPTTAASPSGGPFPSLPAPGPGLFDVAGRIRAAVNGWLRDLVASAIDPAVDLAARSVLATPNLAAPGGRVRELWAMSVGLANTCYVLLVCAGGVLLMTNETLQARYTIKDVAPRLVVGLVASNTSLVLVSVGIDLANALSRALLGPGVDPAQARATLKAVLVVPLDDADVWLTLLTLVVVVLALILGASYVLRVAVLVGLTVAGPLALAGHALPQTEALARWWWRAVTACLAIPVAQSLALITALRVFFHADQDRVLGLGSARLVDLLVATCLLWLLARIPTWAVRMVFVGRPGTAMTVAKSYVAYRLLRRGLHRLPP
ncbi:MAG TPA: hypothetical protein VFX88_12265 [Actinomycetota bacterium]|nr:hypothetical protein [Actinomycetota bacterium]